MNRPTRKRTNRKTVLTLEISARDLARLKAMMDKFNRVVDAMRKDAPRHRAKMKRLETWTRRNLAATWRNIRRMEATR